jgi:Cdc6-like AAA superfamily ATPase
MAPHSIIYSPPVHFFQMFNDEFTSSTLACQSLRNVFYSSIDLFLQQFSQFLRRHITENKSETVLVDGPPSCGKTKLLDHIFTKLHTEDSSLAERLFLFRLNGLIHSIESSAIQEILSQYNLQRKIEHDYQFDNLQMLLETIGNEKKVYFIFILDHFEQFT